MNKTICKRVQELRTQYILGLIPERRYLLELDRLLEMASDEKTKELIRRSKDLLI